MTAIKMTEKERQIKIKIVRVLMMWEETEAIPLNIKKLISEHMYDSIKDDFSPPGRGL